MSRPNAQLVFAIMKVSLALFLFMFVINWCASFRANDPCGLNSYLLNGTCTVHAISECPAGYIGMNCSNVCPVGYYGKDCVQVCGCNSYQICDNVLGCSRINRTDCPAGYVGQNCVEVCPAGYYGKGCIRVCQCKVDQICDHIQGCTELNVTGNTTIILDEHSGHSMVRYWLFLVLAFGGGASLVSIIFSLCYYRRRFCGRREEQNQEGAIVRPEIELDCVQIENAEYDDVGEPEPIYVVIDENE